MPSLIIVDPEYVHASDRVKLPDPDIEIFPLSPLITPEKETPEGWLRSNVLPVIMRSTPPEWPFRLKLEPEIPLASIVAPELIVVDEESGKEPLSVKVSFPELISVGPV